MTSTSAWTTRCALFVGALAPAIALADPASLPVPTVDQTAVAARGYFYVGGRYVGEPGKETMQGQMYVEVLAPKDVRRLYPLVLIHGAAQTATNWMGTRSRFACRGGYGGVDHAARLAACRTWRIM